MEKECANDKAIKQTVPSHHKYYKNYGWLFQFTEKSLRQPPGLASDCGALLRAKDTLRDDVTLNWSAWCGCGAGHDSPHSPS